MYTSGALSGFLILCDISGVYLPKVSIVPNKNTSKNPIPPSASLQPLVVSPVLPVSVNLPVLDATCSNRQAVFVLVRLA